ncbi:E3 CR1 alpha [Simian adenovirus A1285]|uniref:E3 CR1 alpha n=2 Tax=Simian mastadenovirus B TaxID=1962299 RepID=H9AAM4_9ADEN|nr:E3 CR1 alpha [Simian adenovirus A1173]AFD22018.1 E3 CR1 alpha [Simian adenovirus A1285]
MKISAVICVLSITSIAAARTPAFTTAEELPTTFSPHRGRIPVYFSNATSFIQLNCTCQNPFIQWLVNRTLCKAFLDNTIFHVRSYLCPNTTKAALITKAPFSVRLFTCIGAGGNFPPCVFRWYLQPTPSTTPTTELTTTAQFNYTSEASNRLWLPYLALIPVIIFAVTLFL